MEDLRISPNAPNEQIDENVRKAVADGAKKFGDICVRLGISRMADDFRSVDRSLQRLRKSGTVYFNKQRQEWNVVNG